MKDEQVSDLDIQALTDNELEGKARERVLEALKTSPVLRARYNRLLAQKQLLMQIWSQEPGSRSIH
jgi:hypothetical protein